MFIRLCYAVVLVTALMSAATAAADTDWLVEIMPGTIHANFAADDFYVRGPNGKETMSLMSSVPNLALGVSLLHMQWLTDLKLGTGMLLNSKLGSYMVYAGLGLSYEVRPSVLIGPHASLTHFFAPEWWGDTQIEFSDNTGFLFGIHVAAGDKIAYLLSIEYLSVDFDVTGLGPNVTASADNLDMSGIAVQFGVRAQF